MTKKSHELNHSINNKLLFITLVSTLIAATLSAVFTLAQFNQSLKPQLLKKVEAIVESVRLDVELAVSVGIPIAHIKGLEPYLNEVLAHYPELQYLAISDQHGALLHHQSRSEVIIVNLDQAQALRAMFQQTAPQVSYPWIDSISELAKLVFATTLQHSSSDDYFLPLTLQGVRIGAVQVGLNSDYIRSQLSNVYFDIVIVLISVLLISFEVIIVLVMFYVIAPFRRTEKLLQRQANGDFSVTDVEYGQGTIESFNQKLNRDSMALQQAYHQAAEQQKSKLNEQLKEVSNKFNLIKVFKEKRINVLDARVPLFVFAFAEELQKSFMPLFVAQYYEPNPWLSQDILLALPISVFMLVVALTTPFAGGWVERWGNKKLFMLGLIPAFLGYIGCAIAFDSYHIIASRALTALGYAIITISCQGYIAAAVSAENRARGMAIFVGVLMAATLCGTALGGIIADRIGYHNVFFISAIITLVAGGLAWVMLTENKGEAKNAMAKPGGSAIKVLIRNPEFVCLIIFCALPAKIILTGFLYYLTPLYLLSLDASQSEIGRIMMVYALVIIPLSPLASSAADRYGKMKHLVVIGTIASGLVLMSLYQRESIMSLLIAITLMGIAHAMLKAPLIAAVMTAAEATSGVSHTSVLGVLRTFERAGSVLGPIMVGALLLYFNFSETLAIIGIGVVFSGLIMAYFFIRTVVRGQPNDANLPSAGG